MNLCTSFTIHEPLSLGNRHSISRHSVSIESGRQISMLFGLRRVEDWKNKYANSFRVHPPHDEVAYRDRAGELLSIPQAERYTSNDWLHNILTIPTSIILNRIKM